MYHMLVIIKKQLKDTLKNKTILIQFILFPLMTVVMEKAITMDGMPEMFFLKLFSVMYMGMAPITSVAAIIAEEKEKNTLRVLMMANVKPWQYLAGIGIYVWVICMIGACAMGGFTGLRGASFICYLTIMGCGFMISIIVGACIGIYAKNQMAATSMVMPGMMVLAFAPMLAIFNNKIAKVAQILYTEQFKRMLEQMSFEAMEKKSVMVVFMNTAVFLALFAITYQRKGLE